MLSKQKIRFIHSLQQKKFRQMYGKFLVEGDKVVRELLTSCFKIDMLYATSDWASELNIDKSLVTVVTEEELAKISSHKTPNKVIAVADVPDLHKEAGRVLPKGLYLVCDGINDPGNAGAIIRIADWFGISEVFFRTNSVDVYNPKTVSAAKGSLFRVKCTHTDLATLFAVNTHLNVYGTFMSGDSIYTSTLNANAFILIGNEANGISEELLPYTKIKIAIPNFGNAESLNAAVATGIVVSEFRRNAHN